MKRELEIDAARGLMLVWMTLTHLPTALTPWVNQPMGYISASEGFIFLSALFTGRIYYRILQRDGPQKMSTTLLLRTLRLYGYHLLLLAFAFIIAAHYAIASSHGQGLYYLLDFFFSAGRVRAVRDAILLIYRPPLLDIVPLYIIFLMLSPLAILLAARFGWRLIIGTSFAIWLLAQFGLREAIYASLGHHVGLQIPMNEMGAFNLWAWQLVWILGVSCGVRWAKEDLPIEKWAERLWQPAAIVAISLFALRYAQIFGLDLGRAAFFFDKWHLGVVRLIDFSAAVMVLVHFRNHLKPLAIAPLVLLGQASLQVFCTHFLFCFLGIGMMGDGQRLYGWRQIPLVVGTLAALLLIAKIYTMRKASAAAKATIQHTAPQPLIASN
jgi:hypothetical protein